MMHIFFLHMYLKTAGIGKLIQLCVVWNDEWAFGQESGAVQRDEKWSPDLAWRKFMDAAA